MIRLPPHRVTRLPPPRPPGCPPTRPPGCPPTGSPGCPLIIQSPGYLTGHMAKLPPGCRSLWLRGVALLTLQNKPHQALLLRVCREPPTGRNTSPMPPPGPPSTARLGSEPSVMSPPALNPGVCGGGQGRTQGVGPASSRERCVSTPAHGCPRGPAGLGSEEEVLRMSLKETRGFGRQRPSLGRRAQCGCLLPAEEGRAGGQSGPRQPAGGQEG